MFGDKIEEELEFEFEERNKCPVEKLLDWANALAEIQKETFYVIGSNPKLKNCILTKVNSKNEAYKIIKSYKLTNYAFVKEILTTNNIEVKNGL
nr:MAG TPA: hypothetical protein [Microviridae sp.]